MTNANTAVLKTVIARSTPSSDTTPITVPLKVAKLASYTFDVRSFHPKPDFGWAGAYFKGDNRGFSMSQEVTSRIKQRFVLDTKLGTTTLKRMKPDPSDHPWMKQPEAYSDPALQQKDELMPVLKKGDTLTPNFEVRTSYGGENHAMPGSKALQENIGTTYVPTLNAHTYIAVTVHRLLLKIDIVAYVSGDGFPNCEAFVTDPKGKSIFLGIHVRKGDPIPGLMFDKKYPMIFNAIRLDIDVDGNFTGDSLWNEKYKQTEKIDDWNRRHLNADPSDGRAFKGTRFERN